MSIVTAADDRVGTCYQVAAGDAPVASPARRRARVLLEAIDKCLNLLEERHLNGSCIGRHRACNALVEALSASQGVIAPEAVWAARTSFALHAALLEWESSVLDELVPRRRELFPDLDAERDDWAVPRLRRDRRQSRARRAA